MTLFIGGPKDGEDLEFGGQPYVEVAVSDSQPVLSLDEVSPLELAFRRHVYKRERLAVSFYLSEDVTEAHPACRVIFHEAKRLARGMCGLAPDTPDEVLADVLEERGERALAAITRLSE